jgi:hypothetical protein
MITNSAHVPEPVVVTVLNGEEWDRRVQESLDALGLTYEELANMARRRDFVSIEAHKLWYSIGD